MSDVGGDAVLQGREAYQQHEWESAYLLFKSRDASQPLAPADVERLSWAAYWTARLAQGDPGSALAAIERAFADLNPLRSENRANLLPAMVTIALAAGEKEAARVAATELEALAAALGTPAPVAAARGGSSNSPPTLGTSRS